MSSLVQLRAIFCGNVQGVGFRWTVVEIAEQYNLTGTTSNLRDGTVEVVAQGERATLEQFVAAVEANPGIARITSVTCKYSKPEGSYSDFQII